MQTAAQILPTLKTPTALTPAAIDLPPHDWCWSLTGAETGPELTTLNTVLKEAQRFCSDMLAGRTPRWLTLVGASGCGKTYIARRICDFVRKHGEGVYNAQRHGDHPETLWAYVTEGGLFSKWLKILDAGREGDFGPAHRAGRAWFKCVDDLGAEGLERGGTAYDFSRNLMGKLSDQRIGKWTVFTSNYNRKQIAETFDTRISSRMMRDGNVIVDLSHVRDFNIRREATAGFPQTR
jgi:hypothetical protein